MSIVSKIKDLCFERGTTMTALERELEFGKGVIRKWDTASPNSDKLEKVADYFHVSIDYLLGRENETLPPKVRTIAAHLADQDITDQKMELIKQYLNTLFDEKEKEIKENKQSNK